MQAIKTVVVTLGLLIIISIALFGWGVYSKMRNPDFKLFDNPPESGRVPTGDQFGEVRIPLPTGCTVVHSEAEGGRLYLRIGPAGGPAGSCERVYVIDPASGRILGVIVAAP